MITRLIAPVRDASIALRVFIVPLAVLMVAAMLLFLADRQAETNLAAIDGIHQAADRQRQQVDDLVATAYLIHSDVSRHLALAGSGLEDAKLAAIRDTITANLGKARAAIGELRAAPLGAGELGALDEIARMLDGYARAVDEMNQMAQIDRLIAIPLMGHVDESFAALARRIVAAQREIGAATEQATQATREAAAAARRQFWSFAGLFLLAVLGAALMLARGIARPLSALTEAMRELAAGRLDITIAGADRRHELGAMARALQVFQESAARVVALEAERETARAASEADKRRAIREFADLFESQVRQVLEQVTAGTGRLRTGAVDLLDRAQDATAQASAVADATNLAGSNVKSAAGAADELSGEIVKIGDQVNRSFEISRGAVKQVEATNADVAGLSQAAERIGEIVRLIQDIASQTNLLALNATIEAARAGAAGKGFAVVASEVKNLAAQTSKATEDIAAQIEAIQGAASHVVDAIRGVGGTVSTIDEVIAQIAGAMKRQSAATGEIARNLGEAASGTGEVSQTIGDVSQSATRTGEAAEEVLKAVELLDGQAATLNAEVERFLGRLRAA